MEFKKITEEIFADNNLKKYLSEKVAFELECGKRDFNYILDESLLDCESPIEQLLAIKLRQIGLVEMYKFNPFIDVVTIDNQVEIKCDKKTYRVDFLIPVIYRNQEETHFVIECDGYEFHQKTKEQVEKDNTRTRDLQAAGYEIIRFSGTEIWHKPYKCAMEVLNIILSKCRYVK